MTLRLDYPLFIAIALVAALAVPEHALAQAPPAESPAPPAASPPSTAPAPSSDADEPQQPAPADATAPEGTPAPADQNAVPAPAQAAAVEDDDMVLNPVQHDFILVNLPTTLRLPKNKWGFMVSHRFTRAINQGSFTDSLSDLFGLDSGASIGLELRYSFFRGTQVGIYRGNSKIIEMFGQWSAIRQSDSFPLSVDALFAIDGTNNFQDSYTPIIGAVISHLVGRTAAFYVQPLWFNNTNPLPSELVDDNDTFVLGLGARVRVRPAVTVVVEWAPRLAGYEADPNVNSISFAIERRAGGHNFQLSLSNNTNVVLSQVARGGFDYDNWYLGFNISRKFY